MRYQERVRQFPKDGRHSVEVKNLLSGRASDQPPQHSFPYEYDHRRQQSSRSVKSDELTSSHWHRDRLVFRRHRKKIAPKPRCGARPSRAHAWVQNEEDRESLDQACAPPPNGYAIPSIHLTMVAAHSTTDSKSLQNWNGPLTREYQCPGTPEPLHRHRCNKYRTWWRPLLLIL